MAFLIVVALLLLIGFPILVLVKFSKHSDSLDDLRKRLDDLEWQINQMGQEIKPKPTASPAPSPVAESVVEPAKPEVAPAPPIIQQPKAPFIEPPSTSAPPFPAPPQIEPKERVHAAGINWEQFMGVKLFAWIGGLALFIGVALFLKYSFEHNLIPPAMRVTIGYITGLGLLIGGVVLTRREYAVTGQTLCGTGVVILYAVTFACHAVYHFPFFSQIPTFLTMAVITAAAFFLAVRLNALVIAVLGILGGFLTPLLLSTGQDNALGLFLYIGLLDCGLIAVALNRRWYFLTLLGAIGTAMMQGGWIQEFFEVSKVLSAMSIFLCFSLTFTVAYLLAQKRKQNDKWLSAASILMASAPLMLGFFLLKYEAVGQTPGVLLSFVFLADICLLTLAFRERQLFRLHLFAGTAVFALLSAWTVQFLSNALLGYALGFCFLFAVLHTVFPLILQRRQPEVTAVWWAHLFPPVALLLMMVPIVRLPEISFLVWIFVFLVDLLAIGLAVVTASVFSIATALVLTLFAAGCWIFKAPAEITAIPQSLLLIGGFGAFFFLATLWIAQRARGRQATVGAPGYASPLPLSQLPVMSALLPFTLLILVVLRLPLSDPSPVFCLAIVFVALLLAVARKFIFDWLPMVAMAAVTLLELAWHLRHFNAAQPGVALAWYVGFYCVFLLFPFLFQKAFTRTKLPWATAALVGPAQFILFYLLVDAAFPNRFMGLLPALFAVPMLVGLMVLLRGSRDDNPARLTQLAWFGGVALFFITLIFPIQFERQWITVGWALEGAALLWLYHRVPHGGLRVTGVALLVIVFVRLGLNPAVLGYHPRASLPILNWYLYTYGIATVCMFIGAKLLAPPRHKIWGNNAPPILAGLGTVLAFLLVNIEIADFFSEVSQTLTFQFGGNFAREMTYTISWALFALILLIIGIIRKLWAARYGGLGLLAITLLKLFFHDLAHLAQLYRIGALISVAIVAILASFFYQKFFAANAKAAEGKGGSKVV